MGAATTDGVTFKIGVCSVAVAVEIGVRVGA